MENVVETIKEIQSRLEREVEWPLTDHIDSITVREHLRVINANLMMLQIYAEQVEEAV
jgi:hypothetical protein